MAERTIYEDAERKEIETTSPGWPDAVGSTRNVRVEWKAGSDAAARVDADRRVRNQYLTLRQWALDAAVVAAQGTNVTQAQQKALFDRFGKVCDGLADLLVTLGQHR